MITVTGLVTTVFLSLAGTQEMMEKIITTTQREKLNLRLY